MSAQRIDYDPQVITSVMDPLKRASAAILEAHAAAQRGGMPDRWVNNLLRVHGAVSAHAAECEAALEDQEARS